MPAPERDTIYYDEINGRPVITYCNFWSGDQRMRKARAEAILRNILRDGWRCKHCHSHIGFHKRADAKYCRESCQKKAARKR